MITIFTAMYPEAAMLIGHFDLKQDHSIPAFSVFSREDLPVRVMITGPGEIKAAAAVGASGILFPPSGTDLYLNFGICMGRQEDIGDLFLIHKLTEKTTGKTFYPDMLVSSELTEASLITGTSVVTTAEAEAVLSCDAASSEETVLYDMEGAAIYQAASLYIGPHQISFLKLVSDFGEVVDPKKISKLIEDKEDEICSYIEDLILFSQEHLTKDFEMEESFREVKAQLMVSLHCSDYMEKELTGLLRYMQLTGKKIDREDPVFGECKSRREGKVKLDEFRKALIK